MMETLYNYIRPEFLIWWCFQKVVTSTEWAGTIRFDVNLKLLKKSWHSYKPLTVILLRLSVRAQTIDSNRHYEMFPIIFELHNTIYIWGSQNFLVGCFYEFMHLSFQNVILS